MADINIKVKQEKIDPEIEQKINEHVNMKKERTSDEKANYGSDSESSTDSNAEDEDNETEDKKNIQLVKTSNELLAELFQVFNAAPPEELLNDDDLLKKAQHNSKSKKVKKEKKKKRKRHKDDGNIEDADEKSDSNEEVIKKEKRKHKKKRKHKSKDDEKSKTKEKERTRSKSRDGDRHKDKFSENGKSKEREKDKSADEKNFNRSQDTLVHAARIKKEKDESGSRHVDNGRKRASIAEKANEPPAKSYTGSRTRHASNSFYHDSSEQEKRHDAKIKIELKQNISESRTKRRHLSSSKDCMDRHDISDISLSDEETYLREREHIVSSSVERKRLPSYQYSRDNRSRRITERYRRRSRSRSRKRPRSRSRDLGIDKKRLLEIARKNAISMFKRGSLPGCANMSEDVKDKVLLQMRYGGRTVQDLTDFCRKISNGEPLSSMSSDNDSDVDKDGNAKPFHHPFQLKERDPIVLQLRASNSAAPAKALCEKSEDLTKAITMQFPVSSGQQHRISETWTPVQTKAVPPLLTLPVATQATSIFKVDLQKNVFEKPLPVAAQQEPAFKPTTTFETSTETATGTADAPAIVTAAVGTAVDNNTNPASDSVDRVSGPTTTVTSTTTDFVPDVPIPSSNTSSSVFPETDPSASFDVSSIISKRLSALRRLQENPMDSEAIKMMYNSQKEMSSWASSKNLPGQFTGSTGANILKAHELNSGPQVWTRRDQLTSTKPVTGGMGMHLLQKMGWKPGEGLGREKTGALQPLLLDVKLDKRGLVAKDDHSGVNGVRNNNAKKRMNNIQDALQQFQNKHPVCILNEMTSKRKWQPPLYELIGEGGPSHNKKFLFSVSMNGQVFTPPEGSNTKKEAKMIAAKYCLEQIGILPPN